MFALVHTPIDVAAVRAAVEDPGFGAILVFEGVARDSFEGRRVTHLSYEAWEEKAVPVLQQIGDEIAQRWGARTAIVHRLGHVPVTEPTVVIAVGAPHRQECYEASRYAIDELKQRVPVWKKENYEHGSSWKANAPA